jgi:hypothetical protein
MSDEIVDLPDDEPCHDGMAAPPGNQQEESIMRVMIRYKLKDDEVDRNLALLHEVYEELSSIRPKGLREATYQLEDKTTFVTFVTLEHGPRCSSSYRRSSATAQVSTTVVRSHQS